MAARLVQRCCWRHLATFTCSPAAATAALLLPSGKASAARALPHPPPASIHTSVPSTWNADRFSVKEQVEENSNSEHRVILNLIEAATSPQELFQLGELHSLNSNQASLVVTRLSRLAVEKKLETGDILQDERFQQLIEIVDSQVSSTPCDGGYLVKGWVRESWPGAASAAFFSPSWIFTAATFSALGGRDVSASGLTQKKGAGVCGSAEKVHPRARRAELPCWESKKLSSMAFLPKGKWIGTRLAGI